MTTDEIVRALRELEAESQCLCTCDECYEDDCLTPLFRETADLIEQLTAGNAKAEAERDALIEQIKERHDCMDCKHNDFCEFDGADDAIVFDCMNCVQEECPCAGCCDSSRWEWCGLTEAPEEGEKDA